MGLLPYEIEQKKEHQETMARMQEKLRHLKEDEITEEELEQIRKKMKLVLGDFLSE